MSSFSSVIRKPGAKVAPKVAPRRNIVRKAPQTQPSGEGEAEQHVASVDRPEPGASAAGSVPPQPEQENVGALDLDSTPRPTPSGIGQDDSDAEERVVSTAQPVRQPEAAAEDVSRSPKHIDGPLANTPVASTWLGQRARPEPSPARAYQSGGQDSRTETPEDSRLASPDSAVSNANTPTTESNVGGIGQGEGNAASEAPRPRSKRKQGPRGSVQVILAQPSLVTPEPSQPSPSPVVERSRSLAPQRAPSSASQLSEAEEALGRVNSQFQRVGDIAAAIIRRTPAPHASAAETEDDDATAGGGGAAGTRPRKRRKRNNGQAQTIEDQATDLAANAPGNGDLLARRRRRDATPEDAEEHEIEVDHTTMFDLCDDRHKWGKKSDVEKQMAANWPDILARRREDAADRLAKSLEGRRKKDKLHIPDQPAGDVDMGAIPELVIENGQLVVASRDVDRHATTTDAANQVAEADIREDTDIYKRVNSSTVGPQRSQIAPGQRWDDLSVELFYQGLKMFGTDFKMISNMIPGKNRQQVKLKYNVEERTNWARVRRCLSQKEEVTLDSYSHMTGLSFGSVSDVYKQIEDDERRLREEDDARRREEGIISQDNAGAAADADVPMPSIEGHDGEPLPGDGHARTGDRQSTAAASRLGSTTTGRHTAQPPNARKKQTARKSQSTTKRGRQAANKSKGFEGVEERLGDVSEVGIPGT